MSRFFNIEIRNADSGKVRRIDLDDHEYVRVILAGEKGEFDLYSTEKHSALLIITEEYEAEVDVRPKRFHCVTQIRRGKKLEA